MIDIDDPDIGLVLRSTPADQGPLVVRDTRLVRRYRHTHHIRVSQQLLLQAHVCPGWFLQVVERHRDQVLLHESEIPAGEQLVLPIGDKGQDDQDGRKRELADDKDLAHSDARAGDLHVPLDNLRRPKARKDQGRIRTGDEPDQDCGTEGQEDQGRVIEIAEVQSLTNQVPKGREQDFHQDQGAPHRCRTQQDSLAKKLRDQLGTPAAYNLPNPDFPGTKRGPGSCEAHVVDTPDEEDHNPQGRHGQEG